MLIINSKQSVRLDGGLANLEPTFDMIVSRLLTHYISQKLPKNNFSHVVG